MKASVKEEHGTIAVADNWLFDLASSLLSRDEDSYSPPAMTSSSYPGPGSGELQEAAADYPTEFAYAQGHSRNQLIGLLHLLDLVVMYDEIVCDEEWSIVWKTRQSLDGLSSFVRTIGLRAPDRETVLAANSTYLKYAKSHFVATGALYYLTLARSIGAPYWPAPARARFLTENLCGSEQASFVSNLREYLDGEVVKISRQLTPMSGAELSPQLFPGFGSSILASSETIEGIVPAALELRNSREARAFRGWLADMELAAESGNLSALAMALGEIRDVISEVRRGLALDEQGDDECTLQIGLSPTITIGTGRLGSLLKGLKPTELHMTFVRQHLDRVLHAANVIHSARRIFGEKFNTGGY